MATLRILADGPSSEPPSEELVFAEDGDVMVVFSNGARVRVASVVLSLASPVFRKMLGPRFLEGQAPRSADEPQDIVLPEDDPIATALLLRIIHFQQPVDESVKPFLLTNFATVADKYDCTYDVGLMSEAMLKRHTAVRLHEETAMFTLGRLTTAAFLLRQQGLFVSFTRSLVLEVTEPFSGIMELSECGRLSASILLALEEQRTAARDTLVTALSADIQGNCVDWGCASRNWPPSIFKHEMLNALNFPSWPPTWAKWSLRSMLEKLQSAQKVQGLRTMLCGHVYNVTLLDPASLQEICLAVRKRAYGMCPECADQERWQSKCPHVEKLKQGIPSEPLVLL
ncbi:hypothetical protein LTR53_012150 [Teratosphaeriaceae sp. CCFEE 6253]|nr:hypothetical protein LTR53_012150 [Teratosphaeriaceae sp. CCFEE 6253]